MTMKLDAPLKIVQEGHLLVFHLGKTRRIRFYGLSEALPIEWKRVASIDISGAPQELIDQFFAAIKQKQATNTNNTVIVEE